jgi:hypothetical protein
MLSGVPVGTSQPLPPSAGSTLPGSGMAMDIREDNDLSAVRGIDSPHCVGFESDLAVSAGTADIRSGRLEVVGRGHAIPQSFGEQRANVLRNAWPTVLV